MVWSTKKRIVVASVVGWGLAIIGAVMIPLMEYIIKKKVEDTVIIRKGGPVYEYWEDPPVPVYLQIYMFNLTNKEEFLNGQKPSLNQIGPYTYSERRVKFNIIFNDNGTVSYRQKRIFQFLPHMSQGDESDMFLAPNPVYWALYNALKYEDPKVRDVIYALTQLFGEHPLMARPLKELIWGYRDPLLNVTKAIDPNWFYTDIIGFFMNKNNTDDGVYTVYTGANNISALGLIDKYNGSSYLDIWSTEYANMINGSDGTLGPPYLPQGEQLYTFSSDICRSVPGIYYRNVQTPQGIGLWRYGAGPNGLANVTVNPDNIGFCTPTRENCLGAGVVNISSCQMVDFFHLPVAISFPHFLFGDPRYIHAVEGVSPNIEEHNTVIDLEPYTGLVLQAYKRLQINMYLEPLANVTETSNIKPVFLPVFWLNESAAIDDKSSKKFYRLLFTPLLIIHVTEIVLISAGALVLICTVIYGVWKYRLTRNFTDYGERSDPGNDTQPIVNYDDDITADQANQNGQAVTDQSNQVMQSCEFQEQCDLDLSPIVTKTELTEQPNTEHNGTLGPPYLPQGEKLYTFSSDICRSVPGIYYRNVQTPQGIGLWRYGAGPNGLANVTVNPDNIGFCTPTRENCLGAGVVNISSCQMVDFFHLPVAISFPHFLFGDPRYIHAVEGVSPNIEEHNTVIDLEPYTGLVLQAYKRLQINMYLEPLANVTETSNIKPVFLPVFWLNESAAIDDKSSKKFYRLLFTPLLIIHVTEIVLISAGALVLNCTVIYGVWKYRLTRNFTDYGERSDPGNDTQPIVNYDDDITADQANQNGQAVTDQSNQVM